MTRARIEEAFSFYVLKMRKIYNQQTKTKNDIPIDQKKKVPSNDIQNRRDKNIHNERT